MTTSTNGHAPVGRVIPGVRGRPLPMDLTAERALLGACLLDRDTILTIADWLPADYFALEKHVWIYEALLACYAQRIPPDLVTVADTLRQHALDQRGDTGPQNRLEAIGGLSYLADLSVEVPTAAHSGYYAQIVERTAVLRQLIQCGGEISALGYDETQALGATLTQAERQLLDLTARARTTTYQLLPEVVEETWAAFVAHDGPATQNQVPTGFVDLDRLLGGGMACTDLVILAARPSVGKTSLAVNIAQHVAEQGLRVVIFTLEMSNRQLVQRMLAMESGIDTRELRSGWVLDDDLVTLAEASGRLARLPIALDDTAALSVEELRGRVRQMLVRFPPDLVVVDYLQLLTSEQYRGGSNRVLEVSHIAHVLKQIGKEQQVPVLALSQLSRAPEQRTNHIPTLADLRESGGLEQTADVVLMLYREELYDKATEKQGITEVHIAKHRNGPLGVVALRFDGRTTRFQNLARQRTPEGY